VAHQPITVVVTFKIKDGQQQRFEEAIREHLPNCVAEPGLLRFWVYRHPDEPTRYLFYEDWSDRAAFQASMEAEWRGPYMAATEHLWAEPRRWDEWERVSMDWDPIGADGEPASLSAAAR
jgi:autoinducer 2-degrading protein